MPDTGAPYFIPYAEPSDLVRDWPELSEDVALAIVAALENIPVYQKRIERFTGDGTWTVPAGVTYAIAHMRGGGGGIGRLATAGDGAASSVAFAGGTVSAPGSPRVRGADDMNALGTAPAANSSLQATSMRFAGADQSAAGGNGGPSAYVVAGATVTPAASITVVVGAGGAAGTSGIAGGSGYVYIEYYEEA